MKHTEHRLRKSFAKWAMRGQRTMTKVKQAIKLRRSRSHDYRIGQNHRNLGQQF